MVTWQVCEKFNLALQCFHASFYWTQIHFVVPLVPSAMDDSALGFQSQGGFIITRSLLWLVHNNPQSHPQLLGPGLVPGPLTRETSTIRTSLERQFLCISIQYLHQTCRSYAFRDSPNPALFVITHL